MIRQMQDCFDSWSCFLFVCVSIECTQPTTTTNRRGSRLTLNSPMHLLDHQILACRHKRRAQPHGINAGTDELHSESMCMKNCWPMGWLWGLVSTQLRQRYIQIQRDHGRQGVLLWLGRLNAETFPLLMSVRPRDCWLDAHWPARSDVWRLWSLTCEGGSACDLRLEMTALLLWNHF